MFEAAVEVIVCHRVDPVNSGGQKRVVFANGFRWFAGLLYLRVERLHHWHFRVQLLARIDSRVELLRLVDDRLVVLAFDAALGLRAECQLLVVVEPEEKVDRSDRSHIFPHR